MADKYEKLMAIFGPENGVQLPMIWSLLAEMDEQGLRDGLEALRRADAIGCFIDPTAWIKSAEDRKALALVVRSITETVAACKAFKRTVGEVSAARQLMGKAAL